MYPWIHWQDWQEVCSDHILIPLVDLKSHHHHMWSPPGFSSGAAVIQPLHAPPSKPKHAVTVTSQLCRRHQGSLCSLAKWLLSVRLIVMLRASEWLNANTGLSDVLLKTTRTLTTHWLSSQPCGTSVLFWAKHSDYPSVHAADKLAGTNT